MAFQSDKLPLKNSPNLRAIYIRGEFGTISELKCPKIPVNFKFIIFRSGFLKKLNKQSAYFFIIPFNLINLKPNYDKANNNYCLICQKLL